MSTLEVSLPDSACLPEAVIPRRTLKDVAEFVFGYALILAVIWTQRPVQRWLYGVAVIWFVVSIFVTFPGWKAMGCSVAGFWRSFWIVGVAVALALAGVSVAAAFQTFHHPSSTVAWVAAFGGYAIWSFFQQILLQGYFLLRLMRILGSGVWASLAAGGVFAAAHLPNPILTPATFVWGAAACLVFLKWRNVYTLAIAHAIFGICIAVTVPAGTLHNMRVGRGYLTYHLPRQHHRNQSDHSVSTVAWVMEDDPTRR